MPEPTIDVANADLLLSTTRAVRKRLDLERPVPREVILECIRLAVQAPTASNSQTWRWVVVTDAAKRAALSDLYGATARPYLEAGARGEMSPDRQTIRVYESALYLLDVLARVPVHEVLEPRLGDAPRGRLEVRRPAHLGRQRERVEEPPHRARERGAGGGAIRRVPRSGERGGRAAPREIGAGGEAALRLGRPRPGGADGPSAHPAPGT